MANNNHPMRCEYQSSVVFASVWMCDTLYVQCECKGVKRCGQSPNNTYGQKTGMLLEGREAQRD